MLAVDSVNQFALLHSGVHSSSHVFDPLQCFVLLCFVCFCIVRVNERFVYGHDIIIRDQVNILNIGRLLFSLKKKGATKQMRINNFFKNK
jgi:hypothetical protein